MTHLICGILAALIGVLAMAGLTHNAIADHRFNRRFR